MGKCIENVFCSSSRFFGSQLSSYFLWEGKLSLTHQAGWGAADPGTMALCALHLSVHLPHCIQIARQLLPYPRRPQRAPRDWGLHGSYLLLLLHHLARSCCQTQHWYTFHLLNAHINWWEHWQNFSNLLCGIACGMPDALDHGFMAAFPMFGPRNFSKVRSPKLILWSINYVLYAFPSQEIQDMCLHGKVLWDLL